MRRRVGTGQLVVAEVTGAVVVATAFAPRWVFLGVAILAAAVLVGTFGRAGGHWWYETVVLARRLHRRRSLAAAQVLRAAVDAGAVPAPVAWLRTLAPRLAPRGVTIAGQTVAVGADDDGWFALAEVWDAQPAGPATPTDGEPASPWAPEARTVRLRVGPAPVPYRELATLLDQVSAVQVVLTPGAEPRRPRLAWVAVRVDPQDALATERAGGISAVERAAAAAVTKAVRTLEAAGWTARAVPPDGLASVLTEATGLGGPPQEHWSWWRAGRIVRTHYVATGWTPAHGSLAPGVSQLAVQLRRSRNGGGEHSGRAEELVLVAVGAPPAVLGRTGQEVVTAAAAQGVHLRRLDGEQAPAVWAIAPTAAPLPR
jgi:ESX secretion system protein EccE